MSETYLQFGSFRLKVGLAVWRNDKEIPLPPKEQALLEMLAQNRGEVVGHTAIYNKLWPRQSIGYPSLARSSLRSKYKFATGEFVEPENGIGTPDKPPIKKPRSWRGSLCMACDVQDEQVPWST
jgi:DNA-binding response OmpR family regulator